MHGSPWPYDSRIPFLLYGPVSCDKGPSPSRSSCRTWPRPWPSSRSADARDERRSEPSTILKSRAEPPRLILLAVLDGMRPDYFDRHAAALPTLDRLRRQGAWFSNAQLNYLPTITSVGHTTVATGADPRVHGIAANSSLDWVSGRPADAYPGLSPRHLMALTLTDV